MDISIGKGKEAAGGVLIRGLVEGFEYTDGPCNSVNRILEAAKVAGIQELVDQDGMKDLDVFSETSSMRIIPADLP